MVKGVYNFHISKVLSTEQMALGYSRDVRYFVKKRDLKCALPLLISLDACAASSNKLDLGDA